MLNQFYQFTQRFKNLVLVLMYSKLIEMIFYTGRGPIIAKLHATCKHLRIFGPIIEKRHLGAKSLQ
jgi:hypothetical protein